MPTQLSIGDRIKRFSDGAPGVVKDLAPSGNIWVQWDQSGLTTVVSSNQVQPA